VYILAKEIIEKVIENEQKEIIEEIKTFKTQIFEIEDNSIIIGIDGWRIRYYFDLDAKILYEIKNNKDNYKGRMIELQYIGDLNDVFTLKRLPIKKWF